MRKRLYLVRIVPETTRTSNHEEPETNNTRSKQHQFTRIDEATSIDTGLIIGSIVKELYTSANAVTLSFIGGIGKEPYASISTQTLCYSSIITNAIEALTKYMISISNIGLDDKDNFRYYISCATGNKYGTLLKIFDNISDTYDYDLRINFNTSLAKLGYNIDGLMDNAFSNFVSQYKISRY